MSDVSEPYIYISLCTTVDKCAHTLLEGTICLNYYRTLEYMKIGPVLSLTFFIFQSDDLGHSL